MSTQQALSYQRCQHCYSQAISEIILSQSKGPINPVSTLLPVKYMQLARYCKDALHKIKSLSSEN